MAWERGERVDRRTRERWHEMIVERGGMDEGTTGGVTSGAGTREMAGMRRVYTQNAWYQKIVKKGSRELPATSWGIHP